jgi:hypothetical protein
MDLNHLRQGVPDGLPEGTRPRLVRRGPIVVDEPARVLSGEVIVLGTSVPTADVIASAQDL